MALDSDEQARSAILFFPTPAYTLITQKLGLEDKPESLLGLPLKALLDTGEETFGPQQVTRVSPIVGVDYPHIPKDEKSKIAWYKKYEAPWVILATADGSRYSWSAKRNPAMFRDGTNQKEIPTVYLLMINEHSL